MKRVYWVGPPDHTMLIVFGGVAVGTFFLSIFSFKELIFAAIQILLGKQPPKRTTSGQTSFFDLNSWQIGGILAVLLFLIGLGWYQMPWILEQIEYNSKLQETNNAVP